MCICTLREAGERIGERAFAQGTVVKPVRISGKASYVGSEAFRGCETLREVVIPSAVKRLGAKAFVGCCELRSVVIQHGAEGIAEDAFERSAAVVTADAVPALDDETFKIAETVYNENFAL